MFRYDNTWCRAWKEDPQPPSTPEDRWAIGPPLCHATTHHGQSSTRTVQIIKINNWSVVGINNKPMQKKLTLTNAAKSVGNFPQAVTRLRCATTTQVSILWLCLVWAFSMASSHTFLRTSSFSPRQPPSAVTSTLALQSDMRSANESDEKPANCTSTIVSAQKLRIGNMCFGEILRIQLLNT